MKPLICLFLSLALLVFKALAVDIHVKNDLDEGVKSLIKLAYQNSEIDHGPTDDEGYMPLGKACKRGYKFIALPHSSDFYSAESYCRPDDSSVVLRVTKRSYIVNLEKNAAGLEANGNFAAAGLVYSELASRLRHADAQKALQYRQKSTHYAVEALALLPLDKALVVDKDQGYKVMTVEFSNELKKWQAVKGVNVSGELDYDTLSTLSQMQIGTAITQQLDNIK